MIGRPKKIKGLELNGRLDNADRRRLVMGEARVLFASASLIGLRDKCTRMLTDCVSLFLNALICEAEA